METNSALKKRLSAVKTAASVVIAGISMFTAGAAFAQQSMHAGDDGVGPVAGQSSRGALGEAFSYVANNSYFRIGVLYFHYYGDSSDLTLDTAAGSRTLPHTGSSLGNKLTLGLNYGLYLPKTGRHLAIEFALAPPLKLDFKAKAAAGGGYDNIGTFKALPPSFTFVYRPWVGTLVQPYIGAGAMYLYSYDKDVNANDPQYHDASLYLSKPVACVGQLGIDFNLPQNMFLNADARYIGCADVKSRLSGVQAPTGLPAPYPQTTNATAHSTNHFKAVVYQISFGMRF